MNRRAFLVGLSGSFVAAPLAAEAQEAAKIPRIGWVVADWVAKPHMTEAFLQGLRDLGYIQGRNVEIEISDAEGKLERLPALAAELMALRVDVIVPIGAAATQAARKATKTIPLVGVAMGDPVQSGFVASLAQPGGNTTAWPLSLCRRLLRRRASESGRLCHGDGGHEWGARRRRALMCLSSRRRDSRSHGAGPGRDHAGPGRDRSDQTQAR
jgi:hypothetical protein